MQRLRQACDHVSLTVQKRLENINMGDGNDETNQDDSFVTSFSSDGGDSDVNGKVITLSLSF